MNFYLYLYLHPLKFNSSVECRFQSYYKKILIVERLVIWMTTDKLMHVFKRLTRHYIYGSFDILYQTAARKKKLHLLFWWFSLPCKSITYKSDNFNKCKIFECYNIFFFSLQSWNVTTNFTLLPGVYFMNHWH